MKSPPVLYAAAALIQAVSTSASPPSAQPEPTQGTILQQGGPLENRQQHPFSVPNVIPQAVDSEFYSYDGTTTKFIGTNSAFLSVPTVTGTSDGQKVTTTATAKVGLYTGTPEGSTEKEYSFVLAPALVDQVKSIMDTTSSKRDLEERGVGGTALFAALYDLLGPEIAVGIAEVVPLGLIGTGVGGLAVVAEAAIALGPIAIAGAAFLKAVVNQFSLIVSLHKDGAFPTAIKVPNPFETFRDTKTCPGTTPKCSTCTGVDLICTTGDNAKCPCEPDSQCKTGGDIPDCGDGVCKGEQGKICTEGPDKDCQCEILYVIDLDPVVPNVDFLSQQQTFLDALIAKGGTRPHPADNPKCGTTGASALVNKVKTNANVRSPKDILYIIRDTLCSDKCENPADFSEKSVFATLDNDGCEIAVSLPNNIEAWAYRGTHSQGAQWQDCYDSFEAGIEKCTDYNPNQTGWVNGPDDYEFFQIGYRPKNGDGKKHKDFGDGSELPHYCPDNPKPACDTCMGGASGNMCSQGDNNGCACEPVTATQPAVPKVTNCATALAASEIICCGWSKDTQKVCSQKIEGCGVVPNLDAICQSPINADGSSDYSVCGQFTADQGIVKGSHMDDIATCLDGAFTLNAEWKYA